LSEPATRTTFDAPDVLALWASITTY